MKFTGYYTTDRFPQPKWLRAEEDIAHNDQDHAMRFDSPEAVREYFDPIATSWTAAYGRHTLIIVPVTDNGGTPHATDNRKN